MKRSRLVLAVALAALGSGCATVPKDPIARAEYRANDDPFEPMNRKIFSFNMKVDRAIIKPAAEHYRKALPQSVRDGLRHFLENLTEPIVLTNDVLQFRFDSATKTIFRVGVNSTAGILGFRDQAAKWQLPRQTGDFGQTLARWGVRDGPYIVLPIAGPSNPRDAIGSGIDAYFDPLRYVSEIHHYHVSVTLGRVVISGLDERERNLDTLDQIQKEAVDFYASMRSLFRQHRSAELHPGAGVPTDVPPDLYGDPGDSAPPAPAPVNASPPPPSSAGG